MLQVGEMFLSGSNAANAPDMDYESKTRPYAWIQVLDFIRLIRTYEQNYLTILLLLYEGIVYLKQRRSTETITNDIKKILNCAYAARKLIGHLLEDYGQNYLLHLRSSRLWNSHIALSVSVNRKWFPFEFTSVAYMYLFVTKS